jgi:hypothetical protein
MPSSRRSVVTSVRFSPESIIAESSPIPATVLLFRKTAFSVKWPISPNFPKLPMGVFLLSDSFILRILFSANQRNLREIPLFSR